MDLGKAGCERGEKNRQTTQTVRKEEKAVTHRQAMCTEPEHRGQACQSLRARLRLWISN